jgi:hypothetical protein
MMGHCSYLASPARHLHPFEIIEIEKINNEAVEDSGPTARSQLRQVAFPKQPVMR